MALRPLGKSFFFAFLQETTKTGFFVPKNKGKIILSTHSSAQDVRSMGDYARWGKVVAVGPQVKEFKNGAIVLIDKLKWSKSFEYDGVMIWKSDENQVLAIHDGNDIDDILYDYSY